MAHRNLQFGRYDYAGFSAFTMYSVCSLAIPLMIVAMGNSLNFPLDQGGMAAGGALHATRSIFMVAALLVCGMISARLGKRLTMGYTLILVGTGIMLCAFTSAYWMLLPCLMLAGFGEGICEGILTPFIQDLHPKAPERYVNIAHSFWSVGICLVVIVAGGLLTLGVNWRIVLGAIGFLTGFVSVLFLWRENPRHKYPEAAVKTAPKDVWHYTQEIAREPRFWICSAAMFFGAGAEFGLTFWATAYIELTFHTSAWVASLGTGVIAIGMFFGRAGFGYIARPHTLRYILLSAGLGTIPVTVLLAFLHPGLLPDWLLFPLLFLLLLLAGIGIAPFWPTTQIYGVITLPRCNSTMLYVYYSALGIPGCGFFSWLMGVTGDHFGLKGAILVVPACLIVFSAIIYWECWIRQKKGSILHEETNDRTVAKIQSQPDPKCDVD